MYCLAYVQLLGNIRTQRRLSDRGPKINIYVVKSAVNSIKASVKLSLTPVRSWVPDLPNNTEVDRHCLLLERFFFLLSFMD